MKKFKHKRKCPKCKQKDVLNTFVKKGSFYLDDNANGAEANRNLMHRRCNTCAYTWNEKVK